MTSDPRAARSSQPHTQRGVDDSKSRQKLESSSKTDNLAQMTCARCGCDLGERTLVFTMEATDGGGERKLCSVCWPKEFVGDGGLAGTAPSSRSARR